MTNVISSTSDSNFDSTALNNVSSDGWDMVWSIDE